MSLGFTCNFCGNTVAPVKVDGATVLFPCQCEGSVNNLELEQRLKYELRKSITPKRSKKSRGTRR